MDQRTRFGTTSDLGCTSSNWSCLGRANTWVVNAQSYLLYLFSVLSEVHIIKYRVRVAKLIDSHCLVMVVQHTNQTCY